ncbi:adenosine deaminase 2 isoform X2 [Stomoxys calcitrans]|uniref:Adenosine deaminase n=1 Tax=Stomoxys calcitrans TaxID=35570 RepID=A0A1I8PLX3_STOCA|nr:adenosine deaminase 2 isoform X2 [Stomoxys calcitrans]
MAQLAECMKMMLILSVLMLMNSVYAMELSYDALRAKIMEAERASSLGGNVWLSSAEEKANSILMNAKKEEINEGLKDPTKYPPSMHFFQGKQFLRQSEVFRIIQKMPKGALLHAHNKGMVSSKWVIGNLTNLYNLYTCRDVSGLLIFTYDQAQCHSEITNVCLERVNAEDKRVYEKRLEKHISMYTMHPESMITDTRKIWKRFENIFVSMDQMFKYQPAFCNYHKRLLEELCEDNIIYAEIRASLSPLYGDNNRTFNSLEVATELEKIVESFKVKHPDFLGLKIIYAKRNKGTVDEMAQRIMTFKQLHNAKPNFIIGFDLIGNEDTGDPLQKFANELTDLPPTANFFFHAGETNWYGKSDWNMMDALLLNTKRIGHGFALPKHPQLWSTIKKRNIAIEVNPLSNQVLGYIWDLRNHPASFLIAENFPIIISSDDPGLWNAKGLSYDFYYAFMAFAPAEADLRFLKQLALNSIKYSILTSEERRKINRIFQKKWEEFIYNVINMKF